MIDRARRLNPLPCYLAIALSVIFPGIACMLFAVKLLLELGWGHSNFLFKNTGKIRLG